MRAGSAPTIPQKTIDRQAMILKEIADMQVKPKAVELDRKQSKAAVDQ